MKLPVYMDNQSTTQVDPRVLAEMMPCLTGTFGNPASRNHSFGRQAEVLVEIARARVADLIHASPEEIVFTSGATESDNLAIKGVCEMYREKGNHVITCVTEHRAVLDTCRGLEKKGFEITYLPVDQNGLVDVHRIEQAIKPQTILISIMAANNEIGVIAPMAQIGQIARGRGVLFHCDGAQALGTIPMDVQAMGIDLLSMSAHKIYGPKGMGALYVRKGNPRVRLCPMMDGGGHERGLRSGTLNVPGIVGFGKACELARTELAEESQRVGALRDRLMKKIFEGLDEVALNGHPTQRLAGNLNVSFAYVEADCLLAAVADELAVSSGSACTSANPEPSYVIQALGVRPDLQSCSIRFGLGRFNTQEEVDWVAEKIIGTVRSLRKTSPLAAMAREKTGR